MIDGMEVLLKLSPEITGDLIRNNSCAALPN
jgi:hypothetical protein